jgi:hypothetical protein
VCIFPQIQGPWIYTGAKGSAVSTTALLDPYLPTINGCIVDGILNVPSLEAQQVVTDDHFVTRDRMGRMVVFMARIGADGYAGQINDNTVCVTHFVFAKHIQTNILPYLPSTPLPRDVLSII